MKLISAILRLVPVALLFVGAVPLRAQSFQTLNSWDVATYFPITAPCNGVDGNFYGTTELSSGLPSLGSGFGAVYQVTPQGGFKIIHAFGYALTPTNGLVQGTDGFFYGTTGSGGSNSAGTLYKVGADGTFASLLDFATTTASNPAAALAAGTDGNFYGTTRQGGTAGTGVFFKVTPAGQYTLLQSFSTATGHTPRGRLLRGSDGNFYGTANAGGTNGTGTVFKATPAGVISVLCHFPASGVVNPQSGLTLGNDGNFYGLTGAVAFRVTPLGALTTAYTFVSASGYVPTGDLVAGSDGFLYGTTIRGATNGYGGVFRLSTAGAYVQVRDFDTTTYSGNYAAVIQSAPGVLAGVTNGRYGPNVGAVFSLSTTGTPPVVLTNFKTTTGKTPSGPLTEGSGGNLFSTTTYEGDSGTVYRVTPAGVVTPLQEFTYAGTVGQAKGGVTLGSDGLLYGLSEGSSGNNGVAYKIPQSGGSATVVKTFTAYSEGSKPRGQLVQAADGNFYGVTMQNGGGYGSVFKMTPAGALTPVFGFDNGAGGGYPTGTLTLASNGQLFGATSQGGSSDRGTLFRVIPGASPTFATITTFINTNGQVPTGVLFAAADGNMYGTTQSGGTNNRGTLFKLTPAGVHSVFGNLGTTSAAKPSGAVVRTSAGEFFGVTSEGGANAVGCVYRVTAAGVVSIIHSFTSTGPRTPLGGLTLGADGLFYGTTTVGGNSGLGTIFKINTAGVITHFRHFDYSTGDLPLGPLTVASSGALYGVSQNGGTGGAGTVYRIIFPPLVATVAATNLHTTTATANGTVTPNGGSTAVHFDYSTSATFASGVISTPVADAGSTGTDVAVSAPLTGLIAGTVYFARLVAENAGGVTVGSTITFTANTVPAGGTFSRTPALAAPGQNVQLAASGWTDPQTPLTYQFLLDDVPLGPPDLPATANVAAPAAAGAHTVKVRVFDARGDFAEASQSLTVDNPPVARAATLGAVAGSASRITVSKLQSYATDADGDAFSIVAVDAASAHGGTVTMAAGVITYTPPSGYTGPDSFTYTLRDAPGLTATGIVNLTVSAAPAASLNVVSFTQTQEGFRVKFAGIPGVSYLIQYRDSLSDPWQTLTPPGPIAAGADGLFEHEDKPAPVPPARFYRAAEVP